MIAPRISFSVERVSQFGSVDQTPTHSPYHLRFFYLYCQTRLFEQNRTLRWWSRNTLPELISVCSFQRESLTSPKFRWRFRLSTTRTIAAWACLTAQKEIQLRIERSVLDHVGRDGFPHIASFHHSRTLFDDFQGKATELEISNGRLTTLQPAPLLPELFKSASCFNNVVSQTETVLLDWSVTVIAISQLEHSRYQM